MGLSKKIILQKVSEAAESVRKQSSLLGTPQGLLVLADFLDKIVEDGQDDEKSTSRAPTT